MVKICQFGEDGAWTKMEILLGFDRYFAFRASSNDQILCEILLSPKDNTEKNFSYYNIPLKELDSIEGKLQHFRDFKKRNPML